MIYFVPKTVVSVQDSRRFARFYVREMPKTTFVENERRPNQDYPGRIIFQRGSEIIAVPAEKVKSF